ncbi:MAG: hypothetical protein WCK55_09835 [Verrucomicrobiota bacterium]
MTAPRFHLSGFPRAIGFAVVLHLLAVLWLAASPALHAAAHPDASEPEHECCVTLFEAGSFNAPPLLAVFSASVVQPVIERIRPVGVWVGEVFQFLGVLEHAPPATV